MMVNQMTNSQKLTTKQKIDSVLGIQPGESIDDFLDALKFDSQQIEKSFNSVDTLVVSKLNELDGKIEEIQKDPSQVTTLQMNDLTMSLKEIEDLVKISTNMFKHIYDNIISSDLIDSELVGSIAKLLESIHVNIAEFISIYKSKQKFIEKIKLMVFAQEQKKEMLAIKHKYDMELLELKNNNDINQNSIQGSGNYIFDTDDIVKSLSDNTINIKFEDDEDKDEDEDDKSVKSKK